MVELHRHLEGSIKPETIFELRHLSPDLAHLSLAELREMMIIPDKVSDLLTFIQRLGTRFMKAVKHGPAEAYRFTWDAISDARRDGVTALELRFCPANFTLDEIERGIFVAAKEAEQYYGMRVGLTYCLRREDPDEVQKQLIKQGTRHFKRGKIIGFDLAGNEKSRQNETFYELFAPLRKHRIPLTVHSGEADGARSVRTAVEVLGATRIGHGTNAAKSPRVMKLLAEKKILIECCLTSNYQTGGIASMDAHPIREFINSGIPVAICTDDPITSGTSLSTEYYRFRHLYNLTDQDIAYAAKCAEEYTFVSQKHSGTELAKDVVALLTRLNYAN